MVGFKHWEWALGAAIVLVILGGAALGGYLALRQHGAVTDTGSPLDTPEFKDAQQRRLDEFDSDYADSAPPEVQQAAQEKRLEEFKQAQIESGASATPATPEEFKKAQEERLKAFQAEQTP